ncbi:hypothetical protein I5U56_06510 [Stenotrophomonas maltophilia]|nr:hypothetical protein [Stenotrophomonas maltophilia]
MTAGVMVSWAIAVVGEFDGAGCRIPDAVVPLLPMVEVVLWAKEQPWPLRVEALQERFNLSRATAYRWHGALLDLHDPAAARRRVPAAQVLRGSMCRALQDAALPTDAPGGGA